MKIRRLLTSFAKCCSQSHVLGGCELMPGLGTHIHCSVAGLQMMYLYLSQSMKFSKRRSPLWALKSLICLISGSFVRKENEASTRGTDFPDRLMNRKSFTPPPTLLSMKKPSRVWGNFRRPRRSTMRSHQPLETHLNRKSGLAGRQERIFTTGSSGKPSAAAALVLLGPSMVLRKQYLEVS